MAENKWVTGVTTLLTGVEKVLESPHFFVFFVLKKPMFFGWGVTFVGREIPTTSTTSTSQDGIAAADTELRDEGAARRLVYNLSPGVPPDKSVS